ncbi:MAG: four helix bundle protein [Desulfobulbaceae bacterium]|uniref:Four helix bundle protein n=1 Tax=Candidatus Desulfobia pelagia TaxID=2841692 RepID=A0A8J6TGB2_9BACT|nr:four helix bundle protein [Candidatus Desulfobia pelagia]
MKNNTENIIQNKSYAFALRIIRLYKYLINEKREYVLAKQILRSGTSIGANVEEAVQGESRADFIHKLAIANKETHETYYWLRLLRDSEIINNDENTQSLIEDCSEIIKLLTAIIKTSKNKSYTPSP